MGRDPIILANLLSQTVKNLGKEGFTPDEIRNMTLQDIRLFYTEHKPISAKRNA